MAHEAQKRYKQRQAHKRQVAAHLKKAFFALDAYARDCENHDLAFDPRFEDVRSSLRVLYRYYMDFTGLKP